MTTIACVGCRSVFVDTKVLTSIRRVHFGSECQFQVELDRERLPYDTTLENQIDWLAHDVQAKLEEIGARAALLAKVALMVARWWDARRSLQILRRGL